jgi:hypothetical protein
MQQSTFIACKRFAHRTGAALIATFGIAGAACATDDVALASPTQPLPVATATQAGGQPQSVDGFGVAVANEALERFRGGDAITDQDVDIHGQVDGNSADRVVSGDNLVSGGAFGDAAGITTVIQNSGSNVLIQNGMNVHVQFVDPGQ